MRLQTIVMTNDSIQITYLEEFDIHEESGIVEARIVEIPHAVLPQSFIDELYDSAQAILDHKRVTVRQPVESFRAPR